jgi:hypothetical protein
MKIRLALALASIAALAIAAVAFAAPSTYKITGGGQTFAAADVDDDGKPTVSGPGDTITFQAFTNSSGGGASNATGQVNIIDRTPDQKHTHFKGVVTCAFIMIADPDKGGGYAELRGYDRSNVNRFFRVRIVDNGQGSAAEEDGVEFNRNFDADNNPNNGNQQGNCANYDPDDVEFVLARGNAKIHKESKNQSSNNQKQGGASTSSTQSTSLTSLTALR